MAIQTFGTNEFLLDFTVNLQAEHVPQKTTSGRLREGGASDRCKRLKRSERLRDSIVVPPANVCVWTNPA